MTTKKLTLTDEHDAFQAAWEAANNPQPGDVTVAERAVAATGEAGAQAAQEAAAQKQANDTQNPPAVPAKK